MKRQAHTVTHRQFIHLVLCITATLIAVTLLTCLLYTMEILRRNKNDVEGALSKYRDSLTTQIGEYVQLAQTAAYDASVGEYLQAEDAYARHLAGQKVSTLFSNLKMVQSGIVEFFVFTPDDAQVTHVSLGAQQPELMERLRECSKPEIIGVYAYASPYGRRGESDFVTIVGCPVFSLSIDEQHTNVIGSVAVAISSQAIERNLRSFYQQEGIRYALIRQDGSIILGDPLKVTARDLKSAAAWGSLERDNLFASVLMAGIPAMESVLVVQTDKIVLLKDLFIITLLVLALVLCMLIVMLCMAGRISREITMPLASLTEAVKQMDADPTHTRQVPEVGNADFQMLSASLNRMLRTEKRLTNELLEANRNLYESELSQKHLELQFLRSQINPHFLYNTLETIRSIAVVRKVPEAALAAKNLAKLLRYSIKGQEIMPLSSELEIIRCYLSIQELRFGSRIRTEFNVDEDVLDLRIPRMCLQPLVENAVVHGLESSVEAGVLTVVCRKDCASLWITVQDTGVGICPEELEHINRLLANPFERAFDRQSSIGMLNVARRLQLSLGNDFTMAVASELNRGTTVTLRMPLGKLEQTGGNADVQGTAG